MAVRTLKDLDRIQDRGNLRLSTGQARTLAAGVVFLLVLAFVLGLQVGRVFSHTEEEVSAPDMASADRSIAEILDGYRAGATPPSTTSTAPVEPLDEEEIPVLDADVEDALAEEAPTAVDEPPTPEEAPTPQIEPLIAQEPATPLPLPPIPEVPRVEVIEPPPAPASRWASLPSPGGSGGYAVQLAAFSQASEAELMASELEQANARVYQMEVEVNGEIWHRVRVGRFATRADAAAWLGELGAFTPFEPIVVKE